jgi:hypothetical protein
MPHSIPTWKLVHGFCCKLIKSKLEKKLET